MKELTRPRLGKSLSVSASKYTVSLPFDKKLYRQDIAVSIAHARALAKAELLSEKEAELIIMGLVSIREEIDKGEFIFREELEDIHMNIEARLAEKTGALAGKLHTARSRNDQVSTDLRMYLKEAIRETINSIVRLQQALVNRAEQEIDTIVPGYTHLQRAQPILLSHYFLAYFEMFQRDKVRFQDCYDRTDVLPLGSGALAGVPYALDREFLAKELGFGRISQNSLDAVSDRDFVIEYEAAASIAMVHLSRLAEELVLWSTKEFAFVEIDDSFSTGSSIMPQKKNPDVAELGRGKAGRVFGHLMGALTMMKGLPLSYNRDMQEDKEALFDTVGTLNGSLQVFSGMLSTLKVNREKARQACEDGYLLATDIADYLVKKGLPFREAHRAVGELVKYAVARNVRLEDLKIDDYRKFSPFFVEDVYKIRLELSVTSRDLPGGTSPGQVRKAVDRAKKLLAEPKR